MKEVVAHLKSVSPYSQSSIYTAEQVPKLPKEGPDAYEKRTWRNRMHTTDEGFVFIPPMAFKNCLYEAAQFLSERIPSKGQSTYTKHFLSGVVVTEGMSLPFKASDVAGEWLFMSAQGKRGSGGKRVWRCYPMIPEWHGRVWFYIGDDTITKEIFARYLAEAGRFVGIGRWRPAVGGLYGRFTVEKLEWSDDSE
jgi:hypothetical protein